MNNNTITKAELAEEFKSDLRKYLIGFVLAVSMSVIPLVLVFQAIYDPEMLEYFTLLLIISVCALLQIVVHFYYFFHVNLSQQKREDLHLILFTTLLLIIMVGGTSWILSNQHQQMY